MIVLQVHSFKYKLLNSGIVMTTPVEGEENWVEVSRDKANLTTGDVALIQSTLDNLNQCLPEDYILPRSLAVQDKQIDAQGTR